MNIHLEIPKKEFKPNETVKGLCEWDTLNGKPPKWVLISLVMYTEGKCHPHTVVVEQQKQVIAGAKGAINFEFSLPEFPWSYDGHLFQVNWAIEAGLGKGKVARAVIRSTP